VQPDVVIPSIYGLEKTEANEPFALAPDTTAAYKYFKPMKPLALAGLQQKSTDRITQAPKFKEGKRLVQMAAGFQGAGKMSLKWEEAEKEIKAIAPGIDEKFFQQPTTVYRVRNNTADLGFAFTTSNEFNSFWLKRLSGDMYVEEAFQILNDFIQLK
ncbi:MAG TPA: carboxy terminal-processing peptidase, partial [Flavisolibacter sp.]|nr:carboxy terminal-processing peptidase [Flavisolibacter sp.]